MGRPQETTTRGSTSLESALAVGLMALVISGLLLVCHLAFTRVWAKSALADGQACLKERKPQSHCRNLVKRRMSFIPLQDIESLNLKKEASSTLIVRTEAGVRLEIQQFSSKALR